MHELVYLNKEKTNLSYLYRIAFLFSLLGLAAIPLAADAFGHGQGFDQSPPISFAGMDVAVRTELTPYDITVGEIDDANMQVAFLDTLTNTTLNDVTYRIEVYRSDDLLARQLFYDVDGTLDVEVRPVLTCKEPRLVDCTRYFGEIHAIAGGYFARGEGRPIIQGPIFDKGGLYNIQVAIEGASSPKTLVAERLEFETFVSVAQEQDFLIQTAHAQEVPVVIKTYYDDITSFDYSDETNTIRFEMPFDWDPDYISQVQVVHEEIRIPKSFEPYAVTDFKGRVNGVELADRILLLDPYTANHTNANIIHFLVNDKELNRINEILGPSNYDSGTMVFELVPQSGTVKNSAEFYLVDPDNLTDPAGSTVNISWDNSYGAGDEIPFNFEFFDESGNLLKDVVYAYSIADEDGNVIMSAGDDPDNLGVDAIEGIDVQKIMIPTQKIHRIDVLLLGQGLDLDPAYAGIGSVLIEVGPSSGMVDTVEPPPAPQSGEITIPSWVKSNAKLWSDGQIDDSTFVSGIEYMIKQGIITVPETDVDSDTPADIPSWVKSNAKLWSDGQIDDQTFASGLQWLVAIGIIAV